LLRRKLTAAKRRLLLAMGCYCILIAAALWTLLPVRSSDDSFVLGLVLCVFAILIIKTLVHHSAP
jgi:hypothetical protein